MAHAFLYPPINIMTENILDLFPLPPVQTSIDSAQNYSSPNSKTGSNQTQVTDLASTLIPTEKCAESPKHSPTTLPPISPSSYTQTQYLQPTFYRPPRTPRRVPTSSEPPLYRHRPYNSGQRLNHRPSPPTSAPLNEALDLGAAINGLETEKQSLMEYRDHSTLTLSVLVGLEVVVRELEKIREFVNQRFGNRKEEEGRWHVERSVRSSKKLPKPKYSDSRNSERLQVRNWNRENVTELEESLKILPLCNFGRREMPEDAPTSGQGIKEMTHKNIDNLLDRYDMHFIPTMFVHEKKAIYLRFIGASRALMHRVLD